MTDTTAPTGEAQRPRVTAQEGLIQTLIALWPYIWPGDRADLKMRVVWAMVLLCFAGVISGDTIIFILGSTVGRKLTKRWPFRSFLTPERLAQVQKRLRKEGNKVIFAARFMPGLRALPAGCRFHPRCPVAEPRCTTDVPALRALGAGHAAACHLARNGSA